MELNEGRWRQSGHLIFGDPSDKGTWEKNVKALFNLESIAQIQAPIQTHIKSSIPLILN